MKVAGAIVFVALLAAWMLRLDKAPQNKSFRVWDKTGDWYAVGD
jgi:hypothetical protein